MSGDRIEILGSKEQASIEKLNDLKASAEQLDSYDLKLTISKGEASKGIVGLGESMKEAKKKVDNLNEKISTFSKTAVRLFADMDESVAKKVAGRK